MKHTFIPGIALFLFSFTLSALDIPLIPGAPVIDGKLDDKCWKDLPWNGGFTTVGTRKPVQEKTRFKIFHDNRHIFIGIEAFESDVDHLRSEVRSRDSQHLWLHDSLELEFTKDPACLKFQKCIIDCTGQLCDLLCVDNNTGTDRFNVIFEWRSWVQVKTGREKDRWIMELAIPFGCMDFTPGEKLQWRLNIGRNRYAGSRKPEISSWAPVTQRQKPKQLPVLNLLSFQPKTFYFDFGRSGMEFVRGANGKYTLKASVTVHNQTGSFKILRSRLTQNGKSVREAEHLVRLGAGQYGTVNVTMEDAQPGECTVDFSIWSGGTPFLLKQFSRKAELQYRSVSARVIRPVYRNNLYATMPDKTIEAVVSLKEGIGSPLTVELTGPKTRLEKKIPVSKAENTVIFNGAELPDGDYILRSRIRVKEREVTHEVRIRKLPYQKGEIWLDRDGVTFIDGKKTMPFGWYGSYTGPVRPWINAELRLDRFSSPENAVRRIQERRKANPNLRVMLVPFQDLDPKGWVPAKIFAFDTMKKALTEKQKQKIREFVSAVGKTDGLLGWYMADEPEGRDLNPAWFEEARDLIAELDPYHPCFLLNYGTDGIRKFCKGCDILIPDCYPQYFEGGITNQPRWCSSEWARTSTALRPAWQMPQGCLWPTGTPEKKGVPPDYTDQRSELFQAFANNVKGIIYYAWYLAPKYSELRFGPEANGKTLDLLKDYLLRNSVPGGISASVTPKVPEFQAALKIWNGQLCIIAVNTAARQVKADFVLKNSFSGTLYGAGEKVEKTVKNGRFSDTLAPLATRIYLTDRKLAAAVPGVPETEKAIADHKAGRKKPGNLVAAGQMTDVDYWLNSVGKGGPGIPKIRASSDQTSWATHGTTLGMHLHGSLFFLFDGDTDPLLPEYSWAPRSSDKKPWLEITLDRPAPVKQVKLYTPNGNLRTCRITDDGGRSFTGKNPDRNEVLTVPLSGNTVRTIRIEFPEFTCSGGMLGKRLLTEVEVY